jgi:hypothetical protein
MELVLKPADKKTASNEAVLLADLGNELPTYHVEIV